MGTLREQLLYPNPTNQVTDDYLQQILETVNLPDLADQLCFDVGVDCHDFYPLSYDEVKAIMQKKNWESPFKKR